MIARLLESRRVWLFIFFAYGVGLWNMSVPLTGDQKVYLSIALEMRERSSLLIPFLFDKVNFLKPPFEYWMTLFGWKVFGLSLFGALVPSVTALIASAYWLRRLSGNKSYVPALLFCGTLGSMTYGSTAQMEIWIVLFYLWAWTWFLEGKLFSALIVVGVMSWIKGPLYPVLWVLSICLYQVLQKNFIWFRTKRTWFALTFGAGVGLAWFVLAAQSYRQEVLDVFLGRENFGKLQTHQGSIFGLWSEFTLSLFPAIFSLILGVLSTTFRARFLKNRNLWIAYGLLPAVFFTFFPYRVNSYLYLLTPLVIWIGWEEHPQIKPSIRTSITAVTGVIATVLIILTFQLVRGGWMGWELGIPICLTFVLWTLSHFKIYWAGIAVSCLLLVNLIRLGAVELGEWDLKSLRDYAVTHPRLAYFIDQEHQDIWHEFGLISSALGSDIHRLKNQSEIVSFLTDKGSLIFNDEQNLTTGLQCQDWIRLQRRIKFPIQEILTHGLSINDPRLHRTFHLCSDH